MERRTLLYTAFITAAAFIFSFVLIHRIERSKKVETIPRLQSTPRRVVALSPGIAEIVVAVGGEDQLAGITEHTNHPPGIAKGKTIVGGFLSPSLERIVSLQPNLVIMRKEQVEFADRLESIGIPVLRVPDALTKDVISSIRLIGEALGRKDRAHGLAADATGRLKAVENAVKKHLKETAQRKTRALFIVGRSDGTLRSMYAAGKGTLPHSIMDAAGGLNAIGDSIARYPVVSSETVISIAPKVIFEVVTPPSVVSAESARISWNSLDVVPAAIDGRVYILTSDMFLIPGPRVIEGVETLARLLYPGIEI